VSHWHHLWQVPMLLGLSESGGAACLSLDRLMWSEPLTLCRGICAHSSGSSMTYVSVLIAVAYFFPGVWKLRECGWSGWVNGLPAHMHFKWSETSTNVREVPWWRRVDRFPTVCRAAAVGTLVFEVALLPLSVWGACFGDAGTLALQVCVLLAFGFHAASWVLMDINFVHLGLCLVAFIDIPRMLLSLSGTPGLVLSDASANCALVPPLESWRDGAAVLVILLQCWYGFRRVQHGWPFACYPTFAFQAPRELPTLAFRPSDGAIRPLWSALDAVLPWRLVWARQASERLGAVEDLPGRVRIVHMVWKAMRASGEVTPEVLGAEFVLVGQRLAEESPQSEFRLAASLGYPSAPPGPVVRGIFLKKTWPRGAAIGVNLYNNSEAALNTVGLLVTFPFLESEVRVVTLVGTVRLRDRVPSSDDEATCQRHLMLGKVLRPFSEGSVCILTLHGIDVGGPCPSESDILPTVRVAPV
jgi:hypothetical protein